MEATSETATGYRVFTRSRLLLETASVMEDPFIFLQRDVPPDEPAAMAWDEALRDYSHVEIEKMSKADQAVILIPLLNALRLRCPEIGPVDPARFAGAADVLLRADPGVAMLAIRNALGRESANRPSGDDYADGRGVSVAFRLMGADPSWFDVFVRISKAMKAAADGNR